MADFNQINQFGSAKPARSREGTSCAECEAMLMDALDGTLSEQQKAAFDRHIATCAECSQMLADARRGASLLDMLKSPRPEPSSLLLDRIIARTSGAQTSDVQTSSAPAPIQSAAQVLPSAAGFVSATGHNALDMHAVSAVPANVIPFRPRAAARFSLRAITHTLMQPRLAMTAAMAFFSITLTLNLTGVHVTDLRASDLAPSNLKHSFFHANASVVRYYENLRVVYELESRLNELKRNSDSESTPASGTGTEGNPGKSPDGTQNDGKPRKAPKSGSGTSDRRGPLDGNFKLAVCRKLPRLGRSGAALVLRSNKLKEQMEGDLV